jgi:hypothetical protein
VNPLHILAWIVIGILASIALIIALAITVAFCKSVLRNLKLHQKHLRSRNISPAAGQVWIQDDSRLEITNVTDCLVCMQSRGTSSLASWCDSREDWNQRVINRRLYLEEVA